MGEDKPSSDDRSPAGAPPDPARPPPGRAAGGADARAARGTRRDVALCLGLISLAFGTVAIVGVTYVRDAEPAPPGDRRAPESIVPARVPYGELLNGSFRELEDGRIEIRYDFDPLPRVEGTFFTESDLYPQLRDWNTSLARSRVRTGVVRGEGRLSGEARTRIAFEGPVEVELELEIVSGAAAIQIATNTAGEGYECLISSNGEVRLRWREVVVEEGGGFEDIATLSERQKKRRREVVVKDLGPAGKIRAPVGRRLRVRFARTEEALFAEVNEVRVEAPSTTEAPPVEAPLVMEAPLVPEAPLGRRDPWSEGNIALRSRGGRVLWDNVRITGRLSRKWLEERMEIATRLTGPDHYEPDDVWAMSRELAADGKEQIRTLSPAGDVDWITVAVPEGVKSVSVETRGLELGISMELSAFDIDGKTRLEYERFEGKEPGAVRIVVPVDDKTDEGRGGRRAAFYVRIAEPEGRCGVYRITATGNTTN